MRIIIIGDMGGFIGAASQAARKRGAKVTQVPDIRSAIATIRNGQSAELIMVDIKQDVKYLIDSLTEDHIVIPVVGCGVNYTEAEAVRAIQSGAKEFIPLPPDENLIAAVLESITEETSSFIFKSEKMKHVIEMAKRTAPTDANILITGESGTGKEVMARFIHTHSKRNTKDMIAINCAAIPDNLLESECFGHEKGAFTGAQSRRIGKFEEANMSTLFLDEISEIDMRLQAKLLRAIQEKEIDRIGGAKPVKLNIRIIATSNRNLSDEVANGNFRNDLYFRLNIINIHMPSLRERIEDLPLLAKHFAQKYVTLNELSPKVLSPEALAKLTAYHWPGNVRELENTMHRAVLITSSDTLTPEDIVLSEAPKTQHRDEGIDVLVGKTVEEVEKALILGTLSHCAGDSNHAATILGLTLKSLKAKLAIYEQHTTVVTSKTLAQ